MSTGAKRWLLLGALVMGCGLTACYPGQAGESGVDGTRAVFPLDQGGMSVGRDAIESWLGFRNNPPPPPASPNYDLNGADHNFFLVLDVFGPAETDAPRMAGSGVVSILATDQQQRVTSMMITLSISDCNDCFLGGLIYWVEASTAGLRAFSGQTQLLDLAEIAKLTLVEEDSSTIVCHSIDPADDGSLQVTAVDVENQVRFPAGKASGDVRGDYTLAGMPLDRELEIQFLKSGAWIPIGTVKLTLPNQTMTLDFDPTAP